MRLLLLVAVLVLSACSHAAPSKDARSITEMTCYQDCRSDLQTEEFCRRRCED
ncbi:MAG TPA: hypothetical protein VEU32_10640 [Burkholderiales bacterium]|nr:hypothetical protein [Burkholderiales bacterium]